MDAKQVIDKILSDAQEECASIKAEADKELAAMQNDLNEQLKQYNAETERLTQKAAKDKKEHILAAARMEIAKLHLAEKRSMLEDVFARVSEQLKNMDDDEYLKLMSMLMKNAVEMGDEEVVIDFDELRIDQNFIDKMNSEIPNGQLKLAEDRMDIDAGFILRKGKIMNNASLSVIVEQTRKKLEIELAKDLFGNLQ
jgi:vacuolar-type H+-ATPase subunit E/Vma4